MSGTGLSMTPGTGVWGSTGRPRAPGMPGDAPAWCRDWAADDDRNECPTELLPEPDARRCDVCQGFEPGEADPYTGVATCEACRRATFA